MARFVREALAGLPVEIREDATGAKIGGDCGNLICVPRSFDPSRPALALFAHLDTPRSTVGVKPCLSDGRITSDGTTILGVDNRAGTSVLLHVLREHLGSNESGNFLVVFTVAEEIGMFGAKHVDLSPYNVRLGFVFDCSKRPGVFIRSAVGCSLYTARFTGRPAHAGVSPEKGISAIRMAALAVSRLTMGRLSPTMTTNVGTIRGGSATNVVAEECTIEGEVRAFDPADIDAHVDEIRNTFVEVAQSLGGQVHLDVSVDFSPFTLDPAGEAFRLTEEVLSSAGLSPEPITYLGGSDANALNALGIPCVNLGIGAQNPHANDEFILLEDFDASARVARELIRRSVHLR